MNNRYSFSEDFKKMAVQKLLNRGHKTVLEIAKELGVANPTLYQWRDKFANNTDMKKITKPQNKTALEKLKIILEFESILEENKGEYLRKNGLHLEHITEWKKLAVEVLSHSNQSYAEKKELIKEQQKSKQLEKEIRRKDRALAEASALLVLKKKADLIWGREEEDE